LLPPGPLSLGGEEAGLALGLHPAALPDLDALEDPGIEIGIAGQTGVERLAVGDSKTNRLPTIRPSSRSGPA
jgi:hypothetical protein